jgi:endogenous inhibitor of DNA gyrase (YacG/DUF329 family)
MADRKQVPPSCPICAKPVVAAALRPFCSQRCADVDLGRWLTGQYRIPAPTNDAEDEAPGEST